MTLSPPAVDPAEPPMTISIKRMNCEREAIFRRSITKTSGGDDIGNLEEGNLKTLSDIGIEMKDIVCDQDTGHEDDGDIGP